jgi:transglutaminase-like putative cysteine protease/uncharacterized protein (DUF58 family)
MRPAGVAAGAPVLAMVTLAAAMVGVLTGAAPVVAVTVFLATVVGLALVSAPWSLRGVTVATVELPDVVEATVATTARVKVGGRVAGSTWVTLSTSNGTALGSAEVVDGEAHPALTFPTRGEVHELGWRLRATDPFGLVWWQRRGSVAATTAVTVPRRQPPAPAAQEPERSSADVEVQDGGHRHGRPDGDIDDLRPFHSGDSASTIAWAPSLRSRRLLTHQRSASPPGRTLVVVDTAGADAAALDDRLGRARTTLLAAVADGQVAAVRTTDGPVAECGDAAAVDRWIAALPVVGSLPATVPWWRRSLKLAVVDPQPRPSLLARILAAATVAWALRALLDAIGAGAATVLLVGASLAVAVALCSGRGEHVVAKPIRLLAGAAFAAGVFALTADLNNLDTPFDLLRGALPQLLVALMVLQNFEAADRRGNRVALCMSAMVVAYAAGLRIDPALAATVGIWAAMWAASMYALARSSPGIPLATGRVLARGVAAGAVAVVAAVAVLQLVAVPEGPARLTLPTVVDGGDAVSNPGFLGGLAGAINGSGDRAPGGRAGGYPGFSPTMDTSTRGPLGDDVVLRVRATAPDFWRGQTFTNFDGRVWSNDELPVDLRDGNQLELYEGVGQPSLESGVRTDELIQTYFLETDVPNLVFAAPVADLLVIDARAGQRPDGTILTDVTLPAGTVYTVVSHRAPVTPDMLRAVGSVSDAFASIPDGELPELQLPPSTTPRTRDLARQLAAGSPSTYDTVLRIEQWLAQNVRYDLDAPVPADGEDAVDHFLFESKLGFCEQIASSTAVMLRSLGVPARVATGYVPSERDEFAGMWISRASDAHAWVEVYFPGIGWQGFDPTAEVPLAGTAERSSIGAGMVRAALDGVRAVLPALLMIAFAMAAIGGATLVTVWAVRRVRRGRWGRLQDRFVTLAVRRGAPEDGDNASLASAWRDHEAFAAAHEVAAALDACAFEPGWHDDDETYHRARSAVARLDD